MSVRTVGGESNKLKILCNNTLVPIILKFQDFKFRIIIRLDCSKLLGINRIFENISPVILATRYTISYHGCNVEAVLNFSGRIKWIYIWKPRVILTVVFEYIARSFVKFRSRRWIKDSNYLLMDKNNFSFYELMLKAQSIFRKPTVLTVQFELIS